MLTIFVPSYNHSEFIIDCLVRIQDISIEHKRIVIIDDASIDDSVCKISDFIERSDKKDEFVFIKKEKNKGVIDSLNLCLSLCESEYLYLMASDDMTIPSGVEKIVDIMEQYQSLQFVIGGANNLLSSGKEYPVYGNKHRAFFELGPKERYSEIFLDSPSPILSQSTIVRTSALREIGVWDSSFIADDYLMFTKLLLAFPIKGVDFDFYPEITCVKYRHHPANSYQNIERQIKMTVQVIDNMAPNYLKNKAIGYKYSYYLLHAIAKGRFVTFSKVFFLMPRKSWGWSVVGIIKNVISRLKEKCLV